ncbi:MAG: ABC transporter permease [Anaerolineae bacterium]|nr:ABC transporter permease [Anaerolineae bacterium]
MRTYIIRRLVQAIPTLFGITIISFLLMLAAPGDPVTLITFNPTSTPEGAAQLRRQLGLDQPPLVQYLYWLIGNDWVKIDVDGDGEGDVYGTRHGFLRGDLGQSLQHKRSVTDLIVERIPATLQLTLTSLIVGYVIGIPLGIIAAINNRAWFDQLSRVLSVIGNAVPGFWLALILIIIFSVNLGWLPMGGMRDITRPAAETNILESIRYMIMPVSVLSLGIIATISRYMRAEVIEVLGQDYVRTAYAKGLSRRTIVFRHVLRNALIPIAALLGPGLGSLLGGAVITEQVFSWPGMGRLVVNGVFQRDYPLIMGSVVLGAVLYILGVLLSDVLYAWIDPRIRLE